MQKPNTKTTNQKFLNVFQFSVYGFDLLFLVFYLMLI